jgi:hypothetical protein
MQPIAQRLLGRLVDRAGFDVHEIRKMLMMHARLGIGEIGGRKPTTLRSLPDRGDDPRCRRTGDHEQLALAS